MSLCPWCGMPIGKEEPAWVSPFDKNDQVHSRCFDLIWKVAYAHHKLVKASRDLLHSTKDLTFWPHREPREIV